MSRVKVRNEEPNWGGAISAWSSFLGQDYVVTDSQSCQKAACATYATSAEVIAIISPADVVQVQKVVEIAHNFATPLYPVSRGRNWGLGSKVPTHDGSVILDLSRLNRIVEFDESRKYMLIEPGVTFAQASSFLQERNSELFLSVIGGPPDASIIGNCIERGEGLGPLGLRTTSVAGLEVVTGSGELLKTGFAAMPLLRDRGIAGISAIGLGPSLDGLFFQSNFGVVVRLRIQLMRKPESFRVFMCTVKKGRDLTPAIAAINDLQERGILKPCSFALWNKYKLLASQRQYPWSLNDGEVLQGDSVRSAFSGMWRDTEWFGFGALYSPTKRIGALEQREVVRILRSQVDSLRCFNETTAAVYWYLHPFIRRLTGFNVREVLNSVYYQSVYLGTPMNTSLKTMYWRKRTVPESDFDPDRDRCGLIWACHIVGNSAEEIIRANSIVETACFEAGIEPNTAFLSVSQNVLHMFVSLIYDRDSLGADAEMMRCFQRIAAGLIDAGFPPYRLGIHAMSQMSLFEDSHLRLLAELKQLFDPRNIIAPGRYGT